MTVYVDDTDAPFQRGPRTYKMSHMFADTHDELMAMATRIGVNTRWLQYPGHPVKEHFDVTQTKKRAALKAGAIQVTSREYGEWAGYRRASIADHLVVKSQLMAMVDERRAAKRHAAKTRQGDLFRSLPG